MRKRSMFVGMDVHQHSIDRTVAESGHDGAVTHFASIGGALAALDGAVATLRQRGAELYFVYEAGPCGYGIYRHLRQAGLACAVVAPAQVPKKTAARVKTDRRDSRTLAIQHRAGALRPIYVPDENDEAMRDLVRAREDAVHSRRRARQRQQHLPQAIRDVGWKAQLRLCGRLRHLTAARKHPHKVRMAIARALTGFMLDIACRVAASASATARPDTIVLRRRPRPTAAPGSRWGGAARPAAGAH